MTLSGLHWRNADPLGEDAFGIFEAGGFGSCVVMSNMGPELPQEIARRFPGTVIIGRLYWPAGDLPGLEQALDVWLDYIEETRDVIAHYQILNEPDIEYPGVTPEDFSWWFQAMYYSLRTICPQRKFGFPMPSIQGEASMDYIRRCADGIEVAGWLAERGYWEQDWQRDDWHWGRRYLKVREMWPTKETHLTEWGCSREMDPAERAEQYRAYLASLPDWIGTANAYIMAGADGWERFWIDAAMARAMRLPEGDREVTKEELWAQLTAPYEMYPALAKTIVGLGGQPIGNEVAMDGFTYLLGVIPTPAGAEDVVAWARTGDWGNVQVAYAAEALPPL